MTATLSAARFALTVAVFAGTLILATTRPRRVHEAWWTCLGATAMVAFRLVTLHDVAAVLASAKQPLLFLLALLVLSALLEQSGFFDWSAVHAARLARGDGRALYRNIFLLGAVVTAVLSLDTTAVILTPLVLAFVERLRLPARPYIFACAFVVNTASLPLPISNLTNLLFAGTFQLSFGAFAARMLPPQVVALAATYALLRRLFRHQLPRTFAVESLPAPPSLIPHRGYFRASVAALAVVSVGYFVAPLLRLEPYVPALVVAVLLAGYGVRARRLAVPSTVRAVGWSVFPFVVGLFVVVRGVENLGLVRWAARAMEGLPSHPCLAVGAVVAASAALSNLVNNLPAALLVRSVLVSTHAPLQQVYGALLGTNIGPNVLPFGSLATILVLGRAGARGESIAAGDFVRVGLVVTPLVLAAATATLLSGLGAAFP